jgi:hypothetical protein
MRELLFGGILYLTGIGVILLLKPSIFFTENGDWKEFGIGRNPQSYTWMPFWLFCIFWALISYSLVFIILRVIYGKHNMEESLYIKNANSSIQSSESPEQLIREPNASHSRSTRGLRRSMKIPPAGFGDMQSGVYMLNQAASTRNGIPHYVYYGPASSSRQLGGYHYGY